MSINSAVVVHAELMANAPIIWMAPCILTRVRAAHYSDGVLVPRCVDLIDWRDRG